MNDEPIILNPPKKKRKKGLPKQWNLIVFVVCFLGLIVAVPYYFLVPKQETFKLQQYELAKVGERDFLITVPATGTVAAGEKRTIPAPSDGTVVKVTCQPGDLVKKGDVLVELASEKVKEELTKAETQYQKALSEKATLQLEYDQKMNELRQQVAEAKESLRRLEKELPTWETLYQLGEISRVNFEEEKKRVVEARRLLAKLEESVEYARKRHQLTMNDTETLRADSMKRMEELRETLQAGVIRAEIDGKIISISAKVGGTLRLGDTVVEIINESSLMVEGKVQLNAIRDVQVGQPVKVTAGDQTYDGHVTYISPVAKESVVEIRVDFDQMPSNVRSQSSVSLGIQVGLIQRQLALPRGRYLSSSQERYVFVVDGDQAVKKEVTFGLINDSFIQVKEGLEVGDTIITSSYDNFGHLDTIQLNPKGGYGI